MHRSRRSFVLGTLLCLAAASGAGAQDATKPAQPAPGALNPDLKPDPLREKTVYVPYEKLEQIFEKEGRGIFLPYEEFLKLWIAAQEKPPVQKPDLPPAAAVLRAASYTGVVAGDVARFETTLEIEALKPGWSELALPFKGVAFESAEISNPKALIAARPSASAGAPGGAVVPAGGGGAAAGGDASEYVVYMPEPGRYQAKLRFSARVTQELGKKTVSFGIPPTAASRLEASIPEEGVRVDVKPLIAVLQTKALDKATGVVAFLGNSGEVTLSWMPPAGKVTEGGAVVSAEQSVRAYLEERELKIATMVTFQVLRGETDVLRVRKPEGTNLLWVKGEDGAGGAAKGDNIREWNQEGDVVVVKLHSPLKAASCHLALAFYRTLQETPATLAVPFPRVEDVIRESGWVALAHEAGLNVRVTSTQGLSQLDRDDVPQAMRGEGAAGAEEVHGFRYLAHPLALELGIEKLTPVVRAASTSVMTLGREEDVWVGWIDYSITKAGLFRLEVRVPQRWSVASIGDPATVDTHQTSDQDGQRTIAVPLKSKALGSYRLPFRLTAQGTAAAGDVTLAPPVAVGSIEDRGLFGVASPRAFEVTTLERERMTSADVDDLFRAGVMTQVGAGGGMPLAYSFRERPASVKVRLVAKKTEIDTLAQHLLEITDGAVKLTHVLDFEVLYAAADRLQFTLPSTLDDSIKVEAKEKKELRKASSAAGVTTWEMALQAPALGVVSVTITHEVDLKALESGKPFAYAVPLPHSAGPDARAEKGFVAVRKEGTLEVTPQATAMEAIDAGDLPDKLRRGQVYSAFRYFARDPALSLTLTRYEYQPLATTVVSLLRVESVLSEELVLKTRATFFVQNTERQYLELAFAPRATILALSVAGKTEQPRKRKDGAGTLVQIPSSAGPSGTFPVVVVYEERLADGALGAMGRAALKTVEVLGGVPVAKIEADLYLPPGFEYFPVSGSLRERAPAGPTLWARFKGLLGAAVAGKPAVAGSPPAPPAPPVGSQQAGIDVDLPTRGLVARRFETMAPVGELEVAYVGTNAFRAIDVLVFIAALAAGWLLITRARWSLLRAGLVFVLVPLAATWFASGPVLDVATSLLAGGALAWVVCVARRAANEWRDRHAARLAFAPDPFLEDVLVTKSQAGSDSAPTPVEGQPRDEAPPEAK